MTSPPGSDDNARSRISRTVKWKLRQEAIQHQPFRALILVVTYLHMQSSMHTPRHVVQIKNTPDSCGSKLLSSPHKYGLQVPTIDTCLYAGQLIQLMIRLRLTSGQPSLRKLEQNANKAGRVLPKSTLADVLRGKRAPSRKILEAFIFACGVSEQEAELWVDALKRTQRTRWIQDELNR